MKKLVPVIYQKEISVKAKGLLPKTLTTLCLIIILIMTSVILAFAVDNIESSAYKITKAIKTEEAASEDYIKYTTEKFKDIKESDWYIETVSKLVGLKVIDGYPDKTFKPQGSINTDAFIKMTVTALGHEIENGENYWAENYIEKAKEIDIIKTGEFVDYTGSINRGEIAKIIVRALDEEYPDNLEEYIYQIKDYDLIPHGFKEYVLKAYVNGIVTGYPDGSFGYDKSATRAEASTMLVRMLDESERKLPQKVEIAERTKELTKEDMERLKSYEPYKLTGDGKLSKVYKSFEILYSERKELCEWIFNEFYPTKYDAYHYNKEVYEETGRLVNEGKLYQGAAVNWLSSPKLIYRSPVSDRVIRGILQIKYPSSNNPYGFKAKTWYEADVEYFAKFTTDKHYIREYNHLSEFKEVK